MSIDAWIIRARISVPSRQLRAMTPSIHDNSDGEQEPTQNNKKNYIAKRDINFILSPYSQ